MITLQSDRAFGELREFLKRQNIFKYGLILTQIPSLLLIVQLTETKWYNLEVLPTLSSVTNAAHESAWGILRCNDKKKETQIPRLYLTSVFTFFLFFNFLYNKLNCIKHISQNTFWWLEPTSYITKVLPHKLSCLQTIISLTGTGLNPFCIQNYLNNLWHRFNKVLDSDPYPW